MAGKEHPNCNYIAVRVDGGWFCNKCGFLLADTYTLIGYLCPTCLTWAEDMTPHCFNGHENDPVTTKAIYTKDEA